MNFLSHLFLSGDNSDILFGNFIADDVKGKKIVATYSPVVAQGIVLHRLIDTHTDQSPFWRSSRSRLQKRHGHYASVIVDIFYDHFLALNWRQFHHQSLFSFSQHVYQILDSRKDQMPDRIQRMLPYMIKENWLENYAYLDGIERTTRRMSRRVAFPSKIHESVQDLRLEYDEFERDFFLFFPTIQRVVNQWMESSII